MKESYKPLFTPWKIGNVEIKNRIVMTSMGGTSIFGWLEPNHFDKEAANFLLERAKNNVGLILPGIAPIRDTLFGKWLFKGQKKFDKLKEFMEEFHKTGAKMFIQLTAGFGRSLAINPMMIKCLQNKFVGTMLKPVLNMDYLTASASCTPNRWMNSLKSRALTIEEIHEMVDAFAKISKLCKDAGVDGIEVHAVHEGYLIDQFTMKYTNQRTDEYGGSFENRYRFPVEIVKAIKKECGKDFPVSLRYSVISKTKGFEQGALPGETYTEVGRDFEESIKAAQLFEQAGYDMLNCDNGTYDAWYWAHPPGYMPENCNLEDVSRLKPYVNIPLVCAGRMEPETAALAISKNKLDAMGVARQFLCDETWVTKLLNDDEKNIRPCICCHNACFDMAHYEGVGNDQPLSDNKGMARCALNPITMQTNKYKIIKAKKMKKVAIIGAGIGGMEAARVLTLRGHRPTIFEKSNRLGGIFNEAAAPSFKEKDRELLAWYQTQMQELKVDIKLNYEVKDLNELKGYDEVIVATGSKPRKLPIKGFDKTIEACEYLSGSKEVSGKVAIIGGGLTGCEIALDLYHKGIKPVIVEMKNDLIAVPGVCLANSSYLRDFFKLHEVEVHLNTNLQEVNDGNIVVSKDNKLETINCDYVIRSVGYIPTPLFQAKKHISLVGDCHKIGNLRTVIWRAWDVAMKI